MLRRTWKQGKKLDELVVGEQLHITETIEDKDLLLYLGLTNDHNPLFIQHDYTAQTIYAKPIVPVIMLNGIIASAISKHLPGPGARIVEQRLKYVQPVYHYETIDFSLQVAQLHAEENVLVIDVLATNANQARVVEGQVMVQPPQ